MRCLVFVLVAFAGFLANSPAWGSPSSTYSLSALRHMLVTDADLPLGWKDEQNSSTTESSCSPIDSMQRLLGQNAVGVTFVHPGDQTVAFEYLAFRTHVISAFERAYTPLMTFASCRATSNGVVDESAANDGLFETRTYGTWSATDRVASQIYGMKFQLGYMVVREKKFLFVVGLENKGALSVRSLENLTEKALAQLP